MFSTNLYISLVISKEKIVKNINIKITEKLVNKMEAKLWKISHKKWIGLTQKSYKNMLEGKTIRPLWNGKKIQ